MRAYKYGGGWRAIWYTLSSARRAGGWLRMYKALRTQNACKTCALGMGGQSGGMVNELGHFPAVCKKSVQAMAADMQGRVRPEFFERTSITAGKRLSPRELEMSGRLVEPMIAEPGDTHYRPISWDQALDRIVSKMQATPPNDSFFYFSGRSSNEAGFLLQMFARLWGTNNVNNCSYYCHQASGVGLSSVTGSGTATIVLDDLRGADLLFLIGGNPASNHPRLMHSLVGLRRRGGKVIVVNPLKETGLVQFKVPSDWRSLLFGSQIADVYIQPHIGGDIAFLSGVAKAIIERGAVDERFVRECADDYDAFATQIAALSWDDIETHAGVPRSQINEVADAYAASKNTIFAWAMGITHHEHGVENVQQIANLAMLRGMLGKPHAGLLPLRGHSNVQGIGSVGATPKLKQAVFDRLQSHFGVTLPDTPGMDTLACMERAAEDGVRFAWCLGGNLYGSNPDATFAGKALNRIDQIVYLSTTLNTGHFHGCGKETIILPVLPRDEEPQPTTQESMFNFVRMSNGGQPRHIGPRSEVNVIASIARRVLGEDHPVDFHAMEENNRIREAIAAIIPGYEAIGRIDETRKEFHIDGRTFHTPRFNTATSRAQFHPIQLPAKANGRTGDRLRLMTIRSEGQFNTVVYEEHDVYRGQDRRDVIMMHEEDIRRMGLSVDQPVRVSSPTGSLTHIRVRPIDIRPGNAVMYYPEANVLVPRSADRKSRTPAFKSIDVTVSAIS